MRHARDGRASLPRRSRWRNSDGLSGTASQRERRMGVGSSICAFVVGRDGERVPVTIMLKGSSVLFHAPRPRVCDLASRVRGNTPMASFRDPVCRGDPHCARCGDRRASRDRPAGARARFPDPAVPARATGGSPSRLPAATFSHFAKAATRPSSVVRLRDYRRSAAAPCCEPPAGAYTHYTGRQCGSDSTSYMHTRTARAARNPIGRSGATAFM
jgi:hypothetical protein